VRRGVHVHRTPSPRFPPSPPLARAGDEYKPRSEAPRGHSHSCGPRPHAVTLAVTITVTFGTTTYVDAPQTEPAIVSHIDRVLNCKNISTVSGICPYFPFTTRDPPTQLGNCAPGSQASDQSTPKRHAERAQSERAQ